MKTSPPCQGSLAEITNQRFSLKYQMFRQQQAAETSGISKNSLVGDFRKRTLSDATQLDKLLQSPPSIDNTDYTTVINCNYIALRIC